MCTVSAVFSADRSALRLMINRDERRLRKQARPPAWFESDGVAAAWPVDQEAGGTWSAVTANGLAFAMLNVSGSALSAERDGRQISRGDIIPFLAAAVDTADAERRFVAGPAQWPCRPFKLLVASMNGLLLLTPHAAAEIDAPCVLSTSSLGDHLVEEPRRGLFDELLRGSASAWQAQDRLHQHAWPDRRHLSVLMSRADACTVSRTEIVITHDRGAMRYAALKDGWPVGIAAPAITIANRRAAAAA